jgi:nucleotide-binding universal stress UspA family protein
MKLLIPVDGSPACDAALDFIVSRAGHLGADTALQLLHVQAPIPPRAARAAGREVVRSFQRAEAEAVFAPALERLSAAGLKAKTRQVVGSPGEVVSRTATLDHPDLVVMGSRGQTAIKGLLFGSVTQAVLAASNAPLLVLREGRPPRGESLRVLIALDGSRHGLAAVRTALALRALFGPSPRFRLLHVADTSAETNGFDAAVGPAVALFAKAGFETEQVQRVGHKTGDEIVDYLSGHPADLLVMGSHGHGAFKAVMLGSVATRVAARSKLPLLIVRPRARRLKSVDKKG